MARVQYGVIVTELKGKIQGQVFQGGNVGYVLRNKGYTKGISSERRNNAATIQSANAAAWRSLTDPERATWTAIVNDWVFYDKFGVAYIGTGYQVYMAYANYLKTIAPTAPVISPSPIAVPTDPGTRTLVYSLATGLKLNWINAGDVTDSIVIFGAAPVSPGRNTNDARYLRIGYEGADSITTLDITTQYTSVFGVPQIGQRVIIRVFWQDVDWMYPYYESIVSAIVTA